MDIRKIKKLIELLEERDIFEIEIKEGEESLRLTRHHPGSSEMPARYFSHPPQQIASPPPPTITHDSKPTLAITPGHKIHSPMVGTMYSSPSPDTPSFVSIGQSVKTGDTLCIIEAMKMFNEIESDRTGTIKEILVKNGEPVEYDQVLFIIE